MQFAFTWQNEFLTTHAGSIGEMAAALEDAARDLREMERDGVALDPDSGMEMDYALLVTTDPEVARKYDFQQEYSDGPCLVLGSEICHDCGAQPGTFHQRGCDVESCPNCGGQFIFCECLPNEKRPRLPWTGEWTGKAECREWGWYCRFVPGSGWVPCSPDDPGAGPDLHRLASDAKWDREARRYVRR